jgi:hypothetical protein
MLVGKVSMTKSEILTLTPFDDVQFSLQDQYHVNISNELTHWLNKQIHSDHIELKNTVSSSNCRVFNHGRSYPSEITYSLTIPSNQTYKFNGKGFDGNQQLSKTHNIYVSVPRKYYVGGCDAIEFKVEKGARMEIGSEYHLLHSGSGSSGYKAYQADVVVGRETDFYLSGELIINNGSSLELSSGSIFRCGDHAIVRLEGTDSRLIIRSSISVDDLAKLTIQGSGKVIFEPEFLQSSNKLGKNIEIEFLGKARTPLQIYVADNAIINFMDPSQTGKIRFEYCYFEFNTNSKLNVGLNLFMFNCDANSNTKSSGFIFTSHGMNRIVSCTFSYFGNAIHLKSNPGSQFVLDYVHFKDNIEAIVVQANDVKILNSNFIENENDVHLIEGAKETVIGESSFTRSIESIMNEANKESILKIYNSIFKSCGKAIYSRRGEIIVEDCLFNKSEFLFVKLDGGSFISHCSTYHTSEIAFDISNDAHIDISKHASNVFMGIENFCNISNVDPRSPLPSVDMYDGNNVLNIALSIFKGVISETMVKILKMNTVKLFGSDYLVWDMGNNSISNTLFLYQHFLNIRSPFSVELYADILGKGFVPVLYSPNQQVKENPECTKYNIETKRDYVRTYDTDSDGDYSGSIGSKPLSASNVSMNKKLSLYPNPVIGSEISIRYPQECTIVRWCITDISGKILSSGNQAPYKIEIGNLVSGLYFFNAVDSNGNQYSERFIIGN